MRMRWTTIMGFVAGCSFRLPEGKTGDPPAGDAARTDSAVVADGAPLDTPSVGPIDCPGSMCGVVCCVGQCQNTTCTGKVFRCDGPEDCNPGEVCCNNQNGSLCTTTCSGAFEVCHTTTDCSFSCNDCGFRVDYGQKVCCE